MTATLAHSAAPDYSVLVWCDHRSLFMQFPSINGPCVITFPRDSIGLAKALDLLRSRHSTEGAGAAYLAPPPPIKRDERFSPNLRDLARDIIRKGPKG